MTSNIGTPFTFYSGTNNEAIIKQNENNAINNWLDGNGGNYI